jgi:hypothetical protein
VQLVPAQQLWGWHPALDTLKTKIRRKGKKKKYKEKGRK